MWKTALSICTLTTGLMVLSAHGGGYTNNFATDPVAGGCVLSGSSTWDSIGGFVQLTGPLDEQRAAMLLPDFDANTPIKSFVYSMDIRVGAGTDLPAEGWSISFVPHNAQVVANGADGPGWASDFTPTANLPDRGSAEGFSIGALSFDHGGGDVVGFSFRLNNPTAALGSAPIPPAGAKVYNGACNDVNSMQTGPNTGGVEGLCWQNFTMIMKEGGLLDVFWKGQQIKTNFPTGWTPQAGRFILGARTSTTGTAGGNEVHHVDNIHIATSVADKPYISYFNGTAGGFTYVLQNVGTTAVLDTNTISLRLDDAPVTPASISQSAGGVTTVTYSTAPNWLAPNTGHKAAITYSSTVGATSSSTNTFSVPVYVVMPLENLVTGVNTAQRGFKMRPYQTMAAQPNSIAWTEQQLAGLQGPNLADLSGADAQGFYTWTGIINFNRDPAENIGRFQAPTYPENLFPGIVATGGAADPIPNSSEEIITFLHFPAAGTYTMGVNSDDGFKLSSAPSVRNPNGVILGIFDGGRGSADSIFTILIQQAGYYPFRLIWENGGGGANCEWFCQNATGAYVPVNDSVPGALQAYYGGPAGPPFVRSFQGYFAGFQIDIQDGSTAVAPATVATKLNGTPVTPDITQSAGVTKIVYTPATPLAPNSSNYVELVFADTGSVYQTNTFSFNVAGAVIPPSLAVPDAQVDKSQVGFRVRTYQTAAVQPNSIEWTELQLAGLKGPNIAELSLASNGWFTNDTTLHYDVDPAGQNGHFNSPWYFPPVFPGLPGTTSSTDNSAIEVLTMVEFPVAGTYTMGVNSDDGFKVTLGKEPRDQFSTILGRFDGTRGAADTLFQFYISQAGIYPLRLIWENGNGGANIEWFTVNSDGSYVLLNDATASGSLNAYRVAPAGPAYVSVVSPGVGEPNVNPAPSLFIQITDQTTTVQTTGITLALNGTPLNPTITKNAGVVTITNPPAGLLPPGSVNTATLVYTDSVAGVVSNNWQFTVAQYTLVPPSIGTPIGSGIASQPGFRFRTVQMPVGFNNTTFTAMGVRIEVSEQMLAGLWGTNQALPSSNVADLTGFTDNGYFDITALINLGGADAGAFTAANGFAPAPAPGIPGTTASYDNFSTETLTYIEFPQAGYYTMGVNSDDCFRVLTTDRAPTRLPATVYFSSPAALASVRVPGDPTYLNDGGFSPGFSKTPVTAKIVYANPGEGCTAPFANAAEMAGNIALVDRGTCEFGLKALNAQQAGAIACIIANNRQDLPITMGAGAVGGSVTIPTMMIHQNDATLIKSHLSAPGGVVATIGLDPDPVLGEFNGFGGRGPADTLFSFGIAQPGVYPFRLVFNNGGSGATGYAVEWFTAQADGTRALLNDVANGGLKAYRARVAPTTPPVMSIAQPGGVLTITYEGTLQSAPSAAGPWNDVGGATSPYRPPTTGSGTFFRAYR